MHLRLGNTEITFVFFDWIWMSCCLFDIPIFFAYGSSSPFFTCYSLIFITTNLGVFFFCFFSSLHNYHLHCSFFFINFPGVEYSHVFTCSGAAICQIFANQEREARKKQRWQQETVHQTVLRVKRVTDTLSVPFLFD